MFSRLILSHKHLSLQEISDHQTVAEFALRQYYSDPNNFLHYTPSEIGIELEQRLKELDHAGAIAVFAAVEAAFMLDAYRRCREKRKDALSKYVQKLGKQKKRLSLEKDIFNAWKQLGPIAKHQVGILKGAFDYRNWLAHGRYWSTQNFGQYYDYETVYEIAERIIPALLSV